MPDFVEIGATISSQSTSAKVDRYVSFKNVKCTVIEENDNRFVTHTHKHTHTHTCIHTYNKNTTTTTISTHHYFMEFFTHPPQGAENTHTHTHTLTETHTHTYTKYTPFANCGQPVIDGAFIRVNIWRADYRSFATWRESSSSRDKHRRPPLTRLRLFAPSRTQSFLYFRERHSQVARFGARFPVRT